MGGGLVDLPSCSSSSFARAASVTSSDNASTRLRFAQPTSSNIVLGCYATCARWEGGDSVASFAQPFHAQGRPRAVANQTLSAVAVRGMDGDSGMDAETSELARLR